MSNFVIMTHDNGTDLSDFFALTGSDSNLSIHEVIFVAAADNTGQLNEHSLLASGNFDRERIYRSALDNGASVTHYKGVRVLVVQPFAREHGEFNEVRWLAIPDSGVLLFGSIVSVQQELDRHLTRTVADPLLVAKLARLRRENDTWSVLSLPVWSPEIRNALAVIDPQLATELMNGDAFQFGIRYGRHVEFEYEVTTASSPTALAMSASLTQSFAVLEKESALLRSTDAITEGNTVRGVIKVSMARYNAWLTEVSARGRPRNTAVP